MKGKWIVVAFCGLMVLSAVFSALRRQEAWTGEAERISISERGFSPRQRPIQGDNPARQFSDSIADAVEKVMPSVVVIRTEAIEYKVEQDLFGFPLFRVPQRREGEGSGVIIDERGYVLTIEGAVRGAKQILVRTASGKQMRATYVASDPVSEVAVIRLDNPPAHLPVLPMGILRIDASLSP